MTRAERVEALEAIVDGATLEETLEALADMCGLKAQHVRETWQDEGLARQWDRMARMLVVRANTARVERL